MFIEGPVGRVEAAFAERGSASALLCHPHPLYGGSMHDRVLQSIDDGLAMAGIGSLRFNFRGVGASEGSHDHGKGEVEDVIFLASWLGERVEGIVLGGYSFGALMALAALPAVQCSKAILVAPPTAMAPAAAPAPGAELLVLLGEEDDLVDADKAADYFAPSKARVQRLAGADHFFAGSTDEITRLVADFTGGQANGT